MNTTYSATTASKLDSVLDKYFREGSRNQNLVAIVRAAMSEQYTFIDLYAKLCAYSQSHGHSSIIDDEELERAWATACNTQNPNAAKTPIMPYHTTPVAKAPVAPKSTVVLDLQPVSVPDMFTMTGLCGSKQAMAQLNALWSTPIGKVNCGGVLYSPGNLRTIEEWTKYELVLPQHEFLVVNAFAMDAKRRTDDEVIAYQHCLFEIDGDGCERRTAEQILADHTDPRHQQLVLIGNLINIGVPVVTVVYSGNKSMHAIIRLAGVNNGAAWKTRVHRMYGDIAPLLGIDPSVKNPSRLSRLAGHKRDDITQEMLYANPDAVGKTPEEITAMVRTLCPVKAQEKVAEATKDATQHQTSGIPGLRPDSKGRVMYEEFKGFLDYMHWEVKWNDITRKVDYIGFPWDNDNPDVLMGRLYDLLNQCERRLSIDNVAMYLMMLAYERRYNPVVDYLEALVWDGKDRMGMVYDCLGVDICDATSRALIGKWLIQCVAMAHNDGDYGAEGVLTLLGKQGIGKTRFFSGLCPNKTWWNEGNVLDSENKDSILTLTSGWLMELGEVDATTRKEQSSLKARITASQDVVRPPYGRSSITTARRVSMCATVNDETYLRDDENRRWWTVTVDSIDRTLANKIHVERDQLWAQVYQIWLADPQCFRLNDDERESLSQRNAKKRFVPYAEELDSIDWDAESVTWMTAMEIGDRLKIPTSSRTPFYKCLRTYCDRHNIKTSNAKGRSRYWMPMVKQRML